MKKLFAKTSNVTNLIDAMDRLLRRPSYLPGMGLVFGDPGLGKTRMRRLAKKRGPVKA